MEARSYRDLRVWQIGIDLVEHVYALSRRFPASETYGLASQLQRAAVSVPANIAEGNAREHMREYSHHVSIARGSLAEFATHIEIAVRLGYVQRAEVSELIESMDGLGRQLTALKEALNRRIEQTNGLHRRP